MTSMKQEIWSILPLGNKLSRQVTEAAHGIIRDLDFGQLVHIC